MHWIQWLFPQDIRAGNDFFHKISIFTFPRQHLVFENIATWECWISSPISIEKYCSKKLLATSLYSSFEDAKIWVEDLQFCSHEAGHVEAASCEHSKSAVVSEYKELLVHGTDSKTNFIFFNIYNQFA